MKKITEDISYFAQHYFYIVSNNGLEKIKLYPKQREVIQAFNKYDRNIVLSSRQMGKSTSYSIFGLHYAIVNRDKTILICGNKLKLAVQILSRIKKAYQMLPNWIKPGVVTYNKTQIQFTNGCKITAQATSQSSGRGNSINVLILDEFAFISPSISSQFMASVFPVVSSFKDSKIIIVSTPNGTNNQFYRIYDKALKNPDKDDPKSWHPSRIDWWQFPGHDQKWKETQIQSLGNDMVRWNQEYGNQFLGSAPTLISGQKLVQLKSRFIDGAAPKPVPTLISSQEIGLEINVWQKPINGHAYIVGADAATGTQSDYHAMTVWDISQMSKIKLVASFHKNSIPPKHFAYVIAKTATMYNRAFVAMQNNGVSLATIDKLCDDFQYQNIINDSKSKKMFGISSSDDKKLDACINFKQIVQTPQREVIFYDLQLMEELQHFQKHQRQGRQPRYMCKQGNDDLAMCTIWAFYYLRSWSLDAYYKIVKYTVDKFGNQIPILVQPQEQLKSAQSELDLQRLDQTVGNWLLNPSNGQDKVQVQGDYGFDFWVNGSMN